MQPSRPTPHRETWGGVVLDTSAELALTSLALSPRPRSPASAHHDTRRVQPIGQLIGGPRRVMPDEACGEVLRDACALTLGDEPLAGGVEHGAAELWVTPAQVGVALHHPVHAELREEPA